jgi:response regulator NasT
MMDDRSNFSLPMIIRIMERDTQLIEAYASENEKLKAKVLEGGLVKKAKSYLMENRHMSEDEAYKYILKLSMDNRCTKAEIAKNILNGVVK